MKKVKIKLTHRQLSSISGDLDTELILQADINAFTNFSRRLAIVVLLKWNHKMKGRLIGQKDKYSLTLGYDVAASIMIFYNELPSPITSLLGNTIHTIKTEINQQLCQY